MASKVLVKMPVQSFAGNTQVTKTKTNANDAVAIGRNADVRAPGSPDGTTTAKTATATSTVVPNSTGNANSNSECRVAQLEQNIKYLQEQHQLMLTGLHHEIDCLRHRNRELQFQLVFAKGTNVSTPSSPEDDKQKLYSNSPKVLNITPLQVEILEKDLGEMKIQLQESECRNVYLSAIVDEQKKKLERYERDRERERERGIQPDPELLRKLDDAESLIRRLRRENSDLRRENAVATVAANATVTYQQPQHQQQRDYHHTPRSGGQRRRGGGHGGNGSNGGGNAASGSNGGNAANAHNNTSGVSSATVTGGPNAGNAAGGSGGGGGGGGAGSGNGGGNQPFRPNWFPPLQTQNYWQQQNRPQNSHIDSLPQLQSAGSHHVVYQHQGHQGHGRRGGGGNNNHYQNGERKYRGNNHQNRGQKSS